MEQLLRLLAGSSPKEIKASRDKFAELLQNWRYDGDFVSGGYFLQVFKHLAFRLSEEERNLALAHLRLFASKTPRAVQHLVTESLYYHPLMDIAYEEFMLLSPAQQITLSIHEEEWCYAGANSAMICEDEYLATKPQKAVLLPYVSRQRGVNIYARPITVEDYWYAKKNLDMIAFSESPCLIYECTNNIAF